jgi:hypothetical protein
MKRLTMKQYLIGLGFLFAFSSSAYAQIYVCTDANGKKDYRNTGVTKGCKLLDLPSSAVPTPPSTNKKPATAKSTPSPANFPKVDDSTQKARDSDRKQILIDELKVEEQKLEALKKEYNGGEVERRADERMPAKYVERVNNLKNDIARTEKNIEALKREIGNLK